MNALYLTFFVSAVISAAAITAFVWAVRGKDLDHSDRLALLPLDDDDGVVRPAESNT